MTQNSNSKEIYIPILCAIFALIGSISGSFLTHKFDNSTWKVRTKFQLYQKLLEKRLMVVERTVQIINKTDIIHTHNIILRGEISKSVSGKVNYQDIADHKQKFSTLNSEFMTTISLCNLFFGPKTQEAVKKIREGIGKENNKWWLLDHIFYKVLLEALRNELIYGSDKL